MATHTDLTQTDLFIAGQGGYHTYRIPALVATTKGTLLAFCEGRKNGSSDTGKIDIVLRRSFDNGTTWEDMQLVAEAGPDCIDNPCPVVDSATGTIWLPLSWNYAERGEPQIVQGLAPRNVYLAKSADDGATWSKPVEITRQVKKPEWTWYATGPTHGIQLQNGRLLVPCDFADGKPDNAHRHFGSHAIYSDDHGASWHIGGTILGQVNECAVAQLADGRVYLNMRAYHGKNRRAVAWSSDNGNTWSEVTLDDALVEPICQASVVYAPGQGMLFSNPASVRRENMTVRLSTDDGKTWSFARSLYSGRSAYSDLAVLPDGRIGCLYERGEQNAYEKITFAQFGLGWLREA